MTISHASTISDLQAVCLFGNDIDSRIAQLFFLHVYPIPDNNEKLSNYLGKIA